MRREILKKLDRIEKKEGVKILYAVEAGSRAWGGSTKDSDYDVRFIYIHPVNWYLSVEQNRDVLEYPIDNQLDISGWDIRKALQLFRKSNPSLMEWLFSPEVYLQEHSLIDRLRELSRDYFSVKATIYHYLHMASGNYRDYLQGNKVRVKKYFYALRPLLACQWIENNQSIPPMEFEKLLKLESSNQALYTTVQKLLTRKKSGEELLLGKRVDTINNYIEERLRYYQDYVKGVKDIKAIEYKRLNYLFRVTLEEVWGIECLVK